MPASKIQDKQEVLRWFAEGWTYAQMSAEYLRKYNIEMTPTAWGNFRHRQGLARRQAMNVDLVPWKVRPEHRNSYPLSMLRMESRRLEGLPMRPEALAKVEAWKRMMRENNYVVFYEPDSELGFYYCPREPGDDDALILRPEVSTRERRPVDA